MTTRFKIGLAVAAALALGVLLLQVLSDPEPSGRGSDDHLEGDPDYEDGTDPRAALKADAGTGRKPGRGDASLTPGGSAPKGDSLIGARLPSGIDYGDPAVREKELTRILGKQPIDWLLASKIVAIMTERIPDDLRPTLLWELKNGKRNQVRLVFMVLRDPSFVEDLFDVLDDPDASTGAQAAALQGLWEMPGAPADEVALRLEGRLTNDFAKDRGVFHAIAKRGGQEAARAMVEYLQRVQNPREVPLHMLQALEIVKDKDAANVVAMALERESSPKVLRALISMVAREDAKAFSGVIINLDRDGQEDEVRTQALFALGRIGDEASVTYLLEKAAESGHYGERALQSIASISSADEGARKRLAAALQNVGSGPEASKARVSLLLAIGAVGDKETLPAVAATLGDSSPKVREAAVRAIGRMGPKAEGYVDNLSRTYAQSDTRVRVRVATALTSIGGRKALSELKGMLAEEGLNASLKRTLQMGVRTVEQRLEAERTGMK